MAERLTDKTNHKAINRCSDYSSCYSCRREICYIDELCEKLGELEDIMDKYGIEDLEQYVEEKRKQDKELRDNIQQLHTIINSTGYDRDTWKKACELASETLKQVMGKPLWIGGNIPTPEVKDSDYFYQQAKKEGNDERN